VHATAAFGHRFAADVAESNPEAMCNLDAMYTLEAMCNPGVADECQMSLDKWLRGDVQRSCWQHNLT